MIGLMDYGAGNLKSVANALDRLGQEFLVCTRPAHLERIHLVLLPGVGQFAAAVGHLRRTGLLEAVHRWGTKDRPILGICLGLHLLFEASEEAPGEAGLGLIPGTVTRLKAATVPHMGWNLAQPVGDCAWIPPARYFYFAHGYAAEPEDAALVVATAEVDGSRVPAAIECGPIRAVQFHPEKSAAAGAELLKGMLAC